MITFLPGTQQTQGPEAQTISAAMDSKLFKRATLDPLAKAGANPDPLVMALLKAKNAPPKINAGIDPTAMAGMDTGAIQAAINGTSLGPPQ